jgi:AbrB family looped-hinge helix DNA binding protein
MVEMQKGKHIFGTVKVGERGQIVIPKEAREIFGIEPGDQVLLVGDESKGIAIVKADLMKNFALKVLEGMGQVNETPENDK